MPFTAAMTGFHRSLLFGPRSRPGSSHIHGPLGWGIVSSRSMPVQNALSPAPVSTMATHVVVEAQVAPQAVQLVGERDVERVRGARGGST